MDKFLVILISVIFASCSSEVEFCNKHNEREIKWTRDIYKLSPVKELIPLSELDGIVQYHGYDSWGLFDHTIRVIKKNENLVIQLYDSRTNLKSRKRENIYREAILTEQEYKLLTNKIDNLICKPVNLETGIGIDGEFYELIIKNDNKLQAFKWQSIFRSKNSEEFKLLKTEVTSLVGELMKLSEFSNGSKQVILGRNMSTSDSIKVDVFVANQCNIRKSEVFLDNKIVNQNRDGVAELTINKRDTIGIQERIMIKVELLNGDIAEL